MYLMLLSVHTCTSCCCLYIHVPHVVVFSSQVEFHWPVVRTANFNLKISEEKNKRSSIIVVFPSSCLLLTHLLNGAPLRQNAWSSSSHLLHPSPSSHTHPHGTRTTCFHVSCDKYPRLGSEHVEVAQSLQVVARVSRGGREDGEKGSVEGGYCLVTATQRVADR